MAAAREPGWVSSTNQRSPGRWRQGRAASMNSAVKRCTHRYTVTWSTRMPRLSEQLLDVAIGQAVSQVPADGNGDYLAWEAEPSEGGRAANGHSLRLPAGPIAQGNGAAATDARTATICHPRRSSQPVTHSYRDCAAGTTDTRARVSPWPETPYVDRRLRAAGATVGQW